MSKKKLWMGLGGLVIVLLLAVALAPFLIPVSAYKSEIMQRVKAATGRELTISGDMSATLFPSAGIRIGRVALSNPPGFSGKQFASAESIVVNVGLMALLSGKLDVRQLEVERPTITLEVNPQGARNWDFSPAPAPAKPQPQKAAPAPGPIDALKEVLAPLEQIALADVRMNGGSLQLVNHQDKTNRSVTELELQLNLPNFRIPAELRIGGKTENERFNVSLRVDSLHVVMTNGETPVLLQVSGNLLSSTLQGKIAGGTLAGQFSLEIPSVPRAAAWIGIKDAKGLPQSFGLNGQLDVTQERINLAKAVIKADQNHLKGSLAYVPGGAVPRVEGTLQSDRIDLTPFLPKRAPAAATAGNAAPAPVPAGGWSAERIDLSGLKSMNASLTVNAGLLVLPQMTVGDVRAHAKLENGALNLKVSNVGLYNGTGQLDLTVDGNASPAAFGHTLKLTGVDAEPFLSDGARFDRISGKLDADMALSARGNSESELVRALDGKGSLKFTNGAVKGVNIAQIVRSAKSMLKGEEQGGEPKQTDFAELGGTFNVSGGVLHNEDLAMKAPLLRLTGKGDVNLPERRVNYRLLPELVNTLKGQGGKEMEGLSVPVIVEGSFDNLSFRPDLAGAAQDALKNPEKAKETVKNVKEEIKQGKEALKEIKKDPEAVKDLLKGLR